MPSDFTGTAEEWHASTGLIRAWVGKIRCELTREERAESVPAIKTKGKHRRKEGGEESTE